MTQFPASPRTLLQTMCLGKCFNVKIDGVWVARPSDTRTKYRVQKRTSFGPQCYSLPSPRLGPAKTAWPASRPCSPPPRPAVDYAFVSGASWLASSQWWTSSIGAVAQTCGVALSTLLKANPTPSQKSTQKGSFKGRTPRQEVTTGGDNPPPCTMARTT